MRVVGNSLCTERCVAAFVQGSYHIQRLAQCGRTQRGKSQWSVRADIELRAKAGGPGTILHTAIVVAKYRGQVHRCNKLHASQCIFGELGAVQ